MSWASRFANVFRRSRMDREIDEELASHLEEALERGRSQEEARRAFGAALRHREASRDIKLLPWLEALIADAHFGWRQLSKHRTTSAAAILSLALAIGATTAAFRLVDAVLLRPLPVREPNRLFTLAYTGINHDGVPDSQDDYDYPTFRKYRDLLAGSADLMVVGGIRPAPVMISGNADIERPYREFISGNFFGVLGLSPALGRLITPDDDLKPGGHPIAVIGYDYWTRRFGRDPKVIGRTFRAEGGVYQVIGVAPKGFVGTEPGAVNDIYIPATMNVAPLNEPGWSWFRILLRPRPGVSAEEVRQKLQAMFLHDRQEQVKQWHMPPETVDRYLRQSILVLPAESGASGLKKDYRKPLAILVVLVALVLLVACANVGNLLSAQATARAREMALRVSIGAGRGRLIQLVLIESAMLAAIASAAGALFSWWSAPLVVSMLAPPENPVRLVLDADWRFAAFGIVLTLAVALLFGLAPALRASAVQPASALRGGHEPKARNGFLHGLVALQVAFCVLVLFVAGLFVSTFDRLSNRPLGFEARHLLALETGSPPGAKVPAETLLQLADHLREIPGVQSAALAGWPLLIDNRWTLPSLHAPGGPVQTNAPFCLDVSRGFFETMRIGILGGRDFRDGDVAAGTKGNDEPVPGVAIVNQAFARAYFGGRNPVGSTLLMDVGRHGRMTTIEIVGYVRDAVYDSLRAPMHPTVYVPAGSGTNTLMVRTSGDPETLAPVLRREIERSSPQRVRDFQAMTSMVRRQTVRERLLSRLSLFFAIVALVLAGIGLYGVLNYSIVQRRREIGIRMALGARASHVVRRVTGGMIATVLLGAAAGLAGGLACARFVESLLFGVKATDGGMVGAPLAVLLVTAVLAALPPAFRAVQVDPAEVLKE